MKFVTTQPILCSPPHRAASGFSRIFVLLLLLLMLACACWPNKSVVMAEPESIYLVQVTSSADDVIRAVQAVTEDQIIHGTFSYEKERTLYGAHAANSVPVFGAWDQPGKVFYKVATGVLAPRYFKDSGDIGTIAVRYVVAPVDPKTTTLRIDAVFVDARNVKHASKGSVEAAEYAAIQTYLQTLQNDRQEAEKAEQTAAQRAEPQGAALAKSSGDALMSDSWALGLTVPQLEQRVSELRREVELQVRDSGASLKSAPYRAASTLASLPSRSTVVVVVLTPYWYGVQTEDGHRGWIHRSQLEPVE